MGIPGCVGGSTSGSLSKSKRREAQKWFLWNCMRERFKKKKIPKLIKELTQGHKNEQCETSALPVMHEGLRAETDYLTILIVLCHQFNLPRGSRKHFGEPGDTIRIQFWPIKRN